MSIFCLDTCTVICQILSLVNNGWRKHKTSLYQFFPLIWETEIVIFRNSLEGLSRKLWKLQRLFLNFSELCPCFTLWIGCTMAWKEDKGGQVPNDNTLWSDWAYSVRSKWWEIDNRIITFIRLWISSKWSLEEFHKREMIRFEFSKLVLTTMWVRIGGEQIWKKKSNMQGST